MGSVPDALGSLYSLQNLELFGNLLTGTIPVGMGYLENLTIFDISDNLFHGPVDFSGLSTLTRFFISSNQFSGSLPVIPSKNLKVYDASNNAFTGNLPEGIFSSPELVTFSTAINCLSIDFDSSELCNSSSLKYLFLSGMSQSHKCSFQHKTKAVQLVAFPTCVLNMGQLEKLYMSGNSYTGSLDEYNLSVHELSFSYNHLYGDLPSNLDGHGMELFDIRKNHFTGRLNGGITAASGDACFYADVNRFSGYLETSNLETFQYLKVLDSNVISCSTLPSNDDELRTYQCGSSDLESAIYFWLGGAFTFVVFILYCWKSPLKFDVEARERFRKEVSVRNILRIGNVQNKLPLTYHMISTLTSMALYFFYGFLFMLVIECIIYPSIKLSADWKSYVTNWSQYQYFTSAVFLRSPESAVCVMIVHAFSIFIFFSIILKSFVSEWQSVEFSVLTETDVKRKANIPSIISSSKGFKLWISDASMCLYRLVVLSGFLLVSFLANVLYVYYIPDLNRVQLIFVQICLQGFSGFLRVQVPFVTRLLRIKTQTMRNIIMSSVMITIEFVFPLLATLSTDSACFQDLIYAADAIEFNYTFQQCAFNSASGCNKYDTYTKTLSFIPSFIASGVCRNAAIRNFLPVMICSCAFQSFVNPILYIIGNCRVHDLQEEISIFGHRLKLKKIVMRNLNYMFLLLWTDVFNIFVYGVASPYGLVAIGVNVISQILLLKLSILRFCHLHFFGEDGSLISDKVDRTDDPNHLETLIEHCYSHLWSILWPGLAFGSITISLFVFEMSNDSDHGNLTVSFMLALLTLTITPVTILTLMHHHFVRNREVYYSRKSVTTGVEMNEGTFVKNPIQNDA